MSSTKIAIIGLGYVGLPLAAEFGKKYDTVGFDISRKRIDELKKGVDLTLETSAEDLKAAKRLMYTTNPEDMRPCNVFIVTVPTPIDEFKRPDLLLVRKATETVAGVLKKGDIVVYESTVSRGSNSTRISSAGILPSASTPATSSTR
jgi:UDP-N-acetyl-D-galactosamine dehydrogenase